MALPILVDIQVAQQLELNIVIGWRPALGQVIPPGTQVKIFRSYHEVSGFEEIADVPVDQGIYIDDEHVDFSKNVNAFYRLEIYNTGDPATTRNYGPVHLHDGPDRIGRMIIRRMAQMLRIIGATPVLIYQKAYGSDEQRDPDGFDEIGGMVLDGGESPTGFEGDALGYYNPILTLMDIRPADEATQVEDTIQHIRVTTARMANFPIIHNGDVIQEVNTGRLWKVTNVVPVRKDQRALLTQDPVSLRQVKHGDIEWKLPVPDTIVPVMTRRRVRRERILQDNEGGTPRFLEVYI